MTLLDDAYVNLTAPLPSQTCVMQAASSNAPQRTDPLWAVLFICLGGALAVATGVFFIILGLAML